MSTDPALTLPAALDALLSALAGYEEQNLGSRALEVVTAAADIRNALQARPVEGWSWTGGATVGNPHQAQAAAWLKTYSETWRDALAEGDSNDEEIDALAAAWSEATGVLGSIAGPAPTTPDPEETTP